MKKSKIKLPTSSDEKRSKRACREYLKSVGKEIEGYKQFWKKRKKGGQAND